MTEKVAWDRFSSVELFKAGKVIRAAAITVNAAHLLNSAERHATERYDSLVALYNDLDDAFGYWTLGIPDIQAIQSALVEELQLLEQARGKK